jgi:prepilin-type processing-associated H-X9-DG protein
MSCSNNLKQIGVAFHNYHEASGQFPPLGTANTTGSWGWGVALLPYIEQDNLYRAIGAPDITSATTLLPGHIVPANPTGALGALLQSRIPTFLCPSDPVSSPINDNFGNYGASNYVASEGVLTWAYTGSSPNWVVNPPGRVTLTGIPDGTSSTMLVGERDRKLGIGAIWAIRRTTGGALGGTARERPNLPYLGDRGASCCNNDRVGTIDVCRRGAFSSMHPDGLNIVLCDGSVRFLSETIESDPVGATIVCGSPPKSNFNWQKIFWADDGFPASF